MRLLWRCASVLLFVAPLCWHSQYAGCTEPRQEDQRCLHAQDISTEEDPGERGHHHRVGERWVAHVHSVSESQQLKGGDAQVEGQQATHRVDENQLQIEGSQAEEMVAELVVEPESPGAWPGSVPPLELEVGEPLPEASITPDQDSGHYSELPPPPHSAVTPIAAEPEDQPATPSSQNRNLNTVSEDDVPDVTASEHSDVDPASADCESESNPYDDASPPVVLENTSNAHTAGTKTHSSPSLSTQPDHRANTSHMLKDKGLSTPLVTETEPGVGGKDPEDIPTFDEWKRKMMEVEKEKIQTPQTPTNGAAHPAKKVQKNINNYASVECGAKILGANPEAKSTSAILKENMDLYMLNPCSNKIWFIIELCESIQVKQLDIANFELFSSTPKDFVVSISDRYPTNKWLKLGTFHGRDERTVQSFPLDEHLYAKYVKMFIKYMKVELVSHFGSEHFCPLSLIRVFGTTMVEEYDLIADPSERTDGQDDDLDNLPGSVPGEVKSSNNLIGSAKDVILNMVNNLAVNVLGGGQGNFSAQDLNATESNAQADASNPSTMPDTEEPETPSTSDTVEARASIPEISFPETPATDSAVPELPPSKDEIVTPLPQDEEEHISSTITLLDKEDDTEERKEKEEQRRQKEGSDYCATSLSSSCSCATSLSEYLHQWCSALLSERRTCQMPKREPTASQRIQTVTPTWLLPLPPSACPQPQPPQAKPHRPKKETQHGHHPSEAAGPLVESSAAQEEAWSKPPPLEPSQIPNLPEPSASKSPPTATPTLSPTPTVEPLQPTELGPDQSWDVQVEEEPTAGVLTPSEGPAVEQLPPWDAKQPELDAAIPSPDAGDPLQDGQPPTFPPVEDEEAAPRNASHPTPNNMTADSEPPHGQSAAPEAKAESAGEDVLLSSSGPHPSHPSPTTPHLSSTEFYAELQQEQWNGNPVHGSNQKESVFMRLNNRIKALEMNMSLSGRYLEQLSQRYRKQMEEMQRAFNKTITKLQNTSRMAEEQDLRQTESIQALQDQLENMTQLVLNLSVRVSQLQREVSDRQSYLLLSLLLFLLLGFLLYFNYQCSSAAPQPALPAPRIPKSYSYCCPESQFTSSGDAGLSRSASYPLLHDADSFHLAGVKDPENLYTEETQEICPDEDKSFLTRKRRCKTKPSAKVEPLAPCPPSALPPPYGAVVCNGGSLAAHPASMLRESLGSTFRDSPSEGSSEASSHSDDTSFCGIATTCSRICTGLPPARTRAEKRALRRQRPRPGEAVAEPLRAPGRSRSGSLPVSTLQDLMRRATEQSSGTFGAKPVLSGRV